MKQYEKAYGRSNPTSLARFKQDKERLKQEFEENNNNGLRGKTQYECTVRPMDALGESTYTIQSSGVFRGYIEGLHDHFMPIDEGTPEQQAIQNGMCPIFNTNSPSAAETVGTNGSKLIMEANNASGPSPLGNTRNLRGLFLSETAGTPMIGAGGGAFRRTPDTTYTKSFNRIDDFNWGGSRPNSQVPQDGHTNTHRQRDINNKETHWNFDPSTGIKPSDWDIVNFTPDDIKSKGNGMCVANKVALRALDKAASLASTRGHPPIKLTNQVHPSRNGAYRDTAYNKKVGGSNGSRHRFGDGYDIWCKVGEWTKEQRLALLTNLYAVGFRGFGHGRNNIHVDTGNKRMWPYPGGVESGVYYDHSMFDGTCKANSKTITKKDKKGRNKIYCVKGDGPSKNKEESKQAASHPPADDGATS